MEAQTGDLVGQRGVRPVEDTGRGKTCADVAHSAPGHTMLDHILSGLASTIRHRLGFISYLCFFAWFGLPYFPLTSTPRLESNSNVMMPFNTKGGPQSQEGIPDGVVGVRNSRALEGAGRICRHHL